MKIKRSLLENGNLMDGIIKLKTEELKKKADAKKIVIDTKATSEKNKIEKKLKEQIDKLNTSFKKTPTTKATSVKSVDEKTDEKKTAPVKKPAPKS